MDRPALVLLGGTSDSLAFASLHVLRQRNLNIATVRRYSGLPFCVPGEMALNLKELCVRPVCRSEEPRYQALMQAHHYLGSLSKSGETL